MELFNHFLFSFFPFNNAGRAKARCGSGFKSRSLRRISFTCETVESVFLLDNIDLGAIKKAIKIIKSRRRKFHGNLFSGKLQEASPTNI